MKNINCLLCILVLFSLNIGLVQAKGPNAKSGGGGNTNCKRDSQLDETMDFDVTWITQSEALLTAFGGSDKSGFVEVHRWIVEGVVGDNRYGEYPTVEFQSGSPELRMLHIRALEPGDSVKLILESRDSCLNKKQTQQTITVPAPSSGDAEAPVLLQEPKIVYIWAGLTYLPYLELFAVDNAAIKTVTIYVDGSLAYKSPDYEQSTYQMFTDNDSGDFSASNQYGFYTNIFPYAGRLPVHDVLEDTSGNITTHDSYVNF